MTVPASAIPAISALMNQRNQLRSRQDAVSKAATLVDMAKLFDGTGLEGSVLSIAQTQVVQYIVNQVGSIEAQLVALGVDLNA